MKAVLKTEASVDARSPAEFLPAGFFAILFFLGCADLVFANRIHGMNFRWGQLFLAAGALVTLLPFVHDLRQRGEQQRMLLRVLGSWALFFALFGLAALHSAQPKASLTKLAWAIVNIGGAAVVCLVGARRKASVLEGFLVSTSLISLIIWVDAMAIYWTDLFWPILGNVQTGYAFEGIRPLRPHAFYYEPSYAGAMLAFAVPLLFVAAETLPRWVGLVAPAIAISAAVLVGARTGLLGLFVSLALCVGWALLRQEWKALRQVALSLVLAAALLAGFFSAPRASIYLRYLAGPLGFSASAQRILRVPGKASEGPSLATPTIEAHTSEGSRLASIMDGLKRWRQRPLLGWGVNNGSMRAMGGDEDDRSIHTGAPNTWVEVGVESGLLGFLAFALAIGVCLLVAIRMRPRPALWGFLAAGCISHFVINLNLTQTFPRLDYWLLFFCIIRAALPDPQPVPVTAPARVPLPVTGHDAASIVPAHK